MENSKTPKILSKLDGFFGITKSGSNFKTEIIAGLTTFMAMVYILMVNAGIFSDASLVAGISYGGMYIATAVGAIVGTLFIAFIAKMPLAQASGMGINAFIVYSLILGNTGLTYANCMVFTLIEGAIFIVLSVSGARKKIFEAIPAAVRKAIGVGIGLFIAFIGFQQAGFVVGDGATLVTLVSFNLLGNGTFSTMIPAVVAIAGVLLIAILSKKNVKGAILWGLLGAAVLYYAVYGVAAIFGVAEAEALFAGINFSNPFDAFGAWSSESLGKVFTEGFNFSAFSGSTGSLLLVIVTTALSLCMIDIFDTIGTLYGACSKGGLLDKDGTPLNMNKCMLADAVATCAGAIAGTSTVTTFVESSSGVAAGGKTGMTALVTGICFILAMFLSPIAQLIPRCATASALVWVGVLMMSGVKNIDWEDAAEAVVAFITFIIMCLGYSINKGIGYGIIAYVIVSIFTGNVKKISIATWVLAAVYLATLLLT